MDERRNGNGRRQIDEIRNRVGVVEDGQHRVFDLLIGPEEKLTDGTIARKTEDGMDHKVDVLYEQERNGGLRMRLVGGDRVLVAAAFLTAAGAVIAALVS